MKLSTHEPVRRRWSFHLLRALGVDVRVHFSFLLLCAVPVLAQLGPSGSVASAGLALAGLLAVMGCVVLHELGHALAARRYGIGTHAITLLPIGGVAQLERMPDDPREELVVAVAGPAVNLVLAALLGLGALLAGLALPGASFLASALGFLVLINLVMFAFNMLPALPLDGGRVLRSLLSLRLGASRATAIASGIGRLGAVALAVAGIFLNPLLLLVAAFVWFGATQEHRMASARALLRGAEVERAMTTDFVTLSPTDRLADVVELLIRSPQRHFPVVHDGRLVGILAEEDLRSSLRLGTASSVSRVMRREFETTRPEADLEAAFLRLNQSGDPAMPVLRRSELVGLVTRESLQSFAALGRAGAQASAA